ncbi:hypothetical protein VKT23_003651 [Stygiomarasmius scandens]|uniref:DUF6533 domain-containing protein n=1 Tax=Marasmiellus scandens TaxID=2682957 RepID=A0ABR1K0W0_9AGAR
MSGNSSSNPLQLPNSLDLPPHLSAHKYFLVCTLTVAAWDTLVLSPRTWRLFKTQGWPVLKILFHFMRLFMPIEFTIVAVAFFDTKWSQASCQKFYLFEPICTAILLACASVVHVIRIHAIYEKSRPVLFGMGGLLALQIVVTAVCCGFYRSVPLLEEQGCIAGPKANWVGIYWLAPTLLYTASFALALNRSFDSLKSKPMGLWKLMLRDGLNLYGAIWIVNMVNMLFWFIMKPTDDRDPVKTIVTSMAAVLTTSMTLRIILSIRGGLAQGGTFATSNNSSSVPSSRTAHVISTRSGMNTNLTNISTHPPHATYNLEDIRSKGEGDWNSSDVVSDNKNSSLGGDSEIRDPANGVKITMDREVVYDQYRR